MTTPIDDLMDDVAEALSECVMMSRDLGLDGDRFIGWAEVYRLEETASRAICSAQHAFSVFANSSRLRKKTVFHERLLPSGLGRLAFMRNWAGCLMPNYFPLPSHARTDFQGYVPLFHFCRLL